MTDSRFEEWAAGKFFLDFEPGCGNTGDYGNKQTESAYEGWCAALAWNTIDSAPKDGTTWIIVCCEGRDEILIAYWHRLLKCWCGQSGHNGSFVKWKEKDVTHWRHIPTPVGVKPR